MIFGKDKSQFLELIGSVVLSYRPIKCAIDELNVCHDTKAGWFLLFFNSGTPLYYPIGKLGCPSAARKKAT